MKIIRGALNAADVSNPNIRYDADCDCLQQTPDGGTTWNPAPGADPRHATGFLKPPVAGSSKQCDAAANMVKWLHDFIDEMLQVFELTWSVTTIINAILAELEILAPYIELLAIITQLAEAIAGIGATALSAAFTSDQYDLLLCIFFCNSDSMGRVSATKLGDIETQITAQLNTTAALITNAILFVQGEIGLSNAGAVGSETGDCSGCECEWCYQFDFTVSMTGVTVNRGDFALGLGLHVLFEGGDQENTLAWVTLTTPTLPTGTTITSAQLLWNVSSVGTAPLAVIQADDRTVTLVNITLTTGEDSAFTSPLTTTYTNFSFLVVVSQNPAGGGDGYMTGIAFRGLGDNPFGTNNC